MSWGSGMPCAQVRHMEYYGPFISNDSASSKLINDRTWSSKIPRNNFVSYCTYHQVLLGLVAGFWTPMDCSLVMPPTP
eukprot:284-Amphidinium_carterae.2